MGKLAIVRLNGNAATLFNQTSSLKSSWRLRVFNSPLGLVHYFNTFCYCPVLTGIERWNQDKFIFQTSSECKCTLKLSLTRNSWYIVNNASSSWFASFNVRIPSPPFQEKCRTNFSVHFHITLFFNVLPVITLDSVIERSCQDSKGFDIFLTKTRFKSSKLSYLWH
jgi:hypothetical protein